jgi:hypothetical protein
MRLYNAVADWLRFILNKLLAHKKKEERKKETTVKVHNATVTPRYAVLF